LPAHLFGGAEGSRIGGHSEIEGEALGGNVPSRPCVHERLRLRQIFFADAVVNLVVVALGVEGRVNVTQIHRLRRNQVRLPQHIQVVAVKEGVHGGDFTGARVFARRSWNPLHTVGIERRINA